MGFIQDTHKCVLQLAGWRLMDIFRSNMSIDGDTHIIYVEVDEFRHNSYAKVKVT
jgi:hypothetical protein